MALLMAFVMVFGMFMGAGPSIAYATEGEDPPANSGGTNGTVNDLWDLVDPETGKVGDELTNSDVNMGTVVTKSQEVAKTVTSLLTILCFISLLFWIGMLAMSAGNPQKRHTALTGIMFSGVALALFGGSYLVVNFFWNFLAG